MALDVLVLVISIQIEMYVHDGVSYKNNEKRPARIFGVVLINSYRKKWLFIWC